ncbi:MAG TPA: hypothetical protein PK395_20295 [bacterium]|nr:hypothetical protein [bacterium]HQQ01075.1 hypothetical protein [bacterium]
MNPLALDTVGWFSVFLDASVKSLVVLALAGLLAAMCRGAAAAVRHLIWSSALIAVIALPFLSLFLPQWQVPVFSDQIRINQPIERKPAVPEAEPVNALIPETSRPDYANSAGSAGFGNTQREDETTAVGSVATVYWSTWILLLWGAGFLVSLSPLAVGNNDGMRVWLNGAQVYEDAGPHKAIPDQDIVPIHLRSGRNTLLCRVHQLGAGWGLYVRLLTQEKCESVGGDAVIQTGNSDGY